MSDVLNLQDEGPEVPSEEKGSYLSIGFCRNSFKSFAFCKISPV
jgi:hypothetical protein